VSAPKGIKISDRTTDADYIARWKLRCEVTLAGCWIFQGYCHREDGSRHLPYPEASYRGKNVRLHRKMLEIKLGRPLGESMHACHSCDRPSCINPDHLFEATNLANQRDMVAKGRHTKQKLTHCLRYGHPLSGDNLQIRNDGRRVCRACAVIKCRLRIGWTLEEALSVPIVHRSKPQPKQESATVGNGHAR